MVPPTARSTPSSLMLTLAAFVIVVAGLRAAVSIVNPFLLALFISVICAAPLFALQSRGVPDWLALGLVVGGVVSFVLLLGAAVGGSVNEFTRTLPGYEDQLRQMVAVGLDPLERMGIPLDLDEIQSRFDPERALGFVASMVSGLRSLLTNTFFILLTTIFMLMEAASFKRKVAAVVADPDASLSRFEEIRDNVRSYLAVKTGTSLATGLLVALLLVSTGVDFPVLFGLLAFLLNFVPNIGSIIAAVPGVIQALVQLGWGGALGVAGGYLAINLVISSGIEPRLMGRRAGLSTLVTFMSLVFWGWVLGPVGMLLSVPLTITAKVALESDPSTRWIAVLLGPASEVEAEAEPAPPAPARKRVAEAADPG